MKFEAKAASWGKLANRNDDFQLVWEINEGSRFLACLGDFTGDSDPEASTSLRAALLEYVKSQSMLSWYEANDTQILEDLARQANHLLQQFNQQQRRKSSSTTLVVALVRSGSVAYLTFGDSGLALWNGNTLDILASGDMSQQRSAADHLPRTEIKEAVKDRIKRVPFFPGQLLLLFTDGLWGQIDDQNQEAKIAAKERLKSTVLEAVKLREAIPVLLDSLESQWDRTDDLTLVAVETRPQEMDWARVLQESAQEVEGQVSEMRRYADQAKRGYEKMQDISDEVGKLVGLVSAEGLESLGKRISEDAKKIIGEYFYEMSIKLNGDIERKFQDSRIQYDEKVVSKMVEGLKPEVSRVTRETQLAIDGVIKELQQGLQPFSEAGERLAKIPGDTKVQVAESLQSVARNITDIHNNIQAINSLATTLTQLRDQVVGLGNRLAQNGVDNLPSELAQLRHQIANLGGTIPGGRGAGQGGHGGGQAWNPQSAVARDTHQYTQTPIPPARDPYSDQSQPGNQPVNQFYQQNQEPYPPAQDGRQVQQQAHLPGDDDARDVRENYNKSRKNSLAGLKRLFAKDSFRLVLFGLIAVAIAVILVVAVLAYIDSNRRPEAETTRRPDPVGLAGTPDPRRPRGGEAAPRPAPAEQERKPQAVQNKIEATRKVKYTQGNYELVEVDKQGALFLVISNNADPNQGYTIPLLEPLRQDPGLSVSQSQISDCISQLIDGALKAGDAAPNRYSTAQMRSIFNSLMAVPADVFKPGEQNRLLAAIAFNLLYGRTDREGLNEHQQIAIAFLNKMISDPTVAEKFSKEYQDFVRAQGKLRPNQTTPADRQKTDVGMLQCAAMILNSGTALAEAKSIDGKWGPKSLLAVKACAENQAQVYEYDLAQLKKNLADVQWKEPTPQQ